MNFDKHKILNNENGIANFLANRFKEPTKFLAVNTASYDIQYLDRIWNGKDARELIWYKGLKT